MSLTGKWSISRDEENYFGTFETYEQALAAAAEYESCFVGQCVAPIAPEDLFDGDVLRGWIDHYVLQHDDYLGEWAQSAILATPAQHNELAAEMRPLIAAWLDRHGLRPTHWNIDPQSVRFVGTES